MAMDSNEIMVSEAGQLEAYFNRVCNSYDVTCKVVTKNKYAFSDDKERYLVFGARDVPDDLNVKEVYIRNARSNTLFYTDYFVVKLDVNASMLGTVEAAVSFCKTVEFLKNLYDEFKAPLPYKIRGDEIGALKEYNQGRNNLALPHEARARFEKGLRKFFKQERTRSKFLKKWRDFYRSDKLDRKASMWKMIQDFRKRDEQITDLKLLHETNDDLKTTVINEHEFTRFREDMKRLYPDVLYSVSELEVQNEGLDRRDKNRSVENVQCGPFGKLVTYEAYCAEREKRFATEGYEAIKELNPAYYETRQLTYKEIDEPYVASVLNSIRFAYAKSDGLHTVNAPGVDLVSFVDVPVSDMMNFVSLAKANKVPFYLDCFGKFGKPNFETIRVVYSPLKDEMMNQIVRRMVVEKVQFSHIKTGLDNHAPTLDRQIKEARHMQVTYPSTEVRGLPER